MYECMHRESNNANKYIDYYIGFLNHLMANGD